MKRFLLLFVLLLAAGSVARAETLLFSLNGIEKGYFKLDSNPTPDDFSVSQGYTKFTNLAFTDSTGTTVNDYQIIFFNAPNGGSFATVANPFGFFGDQVYGGTEGAPVFAPGVYPGNQGGPAIETLTVSVAPEPSSLIFTLTGLASTGFIAVRRKWALRA